jgi:hypothetical protein
MPELIINNKKLTTTLADKIQEKLTFNKIKLFKTETSNPKRVTFQVTLKKPSQNSIKTKNNYSLIKIDPRILQLKKLMSLF